MKHSVIIVYDLKVKNQIEQPGVLQGSVFLCPKGLHIIDTDFFSSLMGFLFLLWLLFTQKGLSKVFEILLGVLTNI
jgi:hypothetical protein